MSTLSNGQHDVQFGSLPLVIGATGHRDLRPADRTELEEKVRSFFKQIREKYPHTPLTLLSPLAEGADRLVAHVALDLGARLIVPLPMRRELYEQDFTTSASRAEFAELLKRAEHFFVLPLAKGYREDEIQEHGAARDHQYEQVGAYIARHSQILLALWDGVYTELVGGTSAIVKFQLTGVPEPYAPPRSELDAAESGEVYHIATPRMKNPEPRIKPFSIRKLSPTVEPRDEHQQPLSLSSNDSGPAKEDGSIGRMYERIYERIDKFNRDALEQSSRLAPQLEESKSRLFPNEEIQGLPNTFKSMRERYAVADTLAIYFQRRMKKTLNKLFVFAFVAAVLFGVYAHFEFEQHRLHASILLFYAFVTIIAYYLLYLPASRKDYQNKYQDYRALAEGMRVQFFWCLADLKLSVADHYLRKQRTELDWICSAVHVWNLPEAANDDLKPRAEPDGMKRIELVLKYWVTNQLNYFVKSSEKDHKQLEGYEPWVKRLFWAGVILASLLAMALLLPHPWRNGLQQYLEENRNFRGLLIILMSTLLVAAALLHNYAEKRALSEHAKQYNRMAQLFAIAKLRLQELHQRDYQGAQRLIAELGKEALAENGDWVLLHRERPLEPPHPG